MASASFDSTVRLWDLATGTEKLVLRGHSGAVRAVAFSPDGRQVASGGDDNVVRLWGAADGHPLSVIPGHTAKIRAVSFDPRGKYLVSASNDRTVRNPRSRCERASADPQVCDEHRLTRVLARRRFPCGGRRRR